MMRMAMALALLAAFQSATLAQADRVRWERIKVESVRASELLYELDAWWDRPAGKEGIEESRPAAVDAEALKAVRPDPTWPRVHLEGVDRALGYDVENTIIAHGTEQGLAALKQRIR